MNSYSMKFNLTREQQVNSQKYEGSKFEDCKEKNKNIQIHMHFGNDQQSQMANEQESPLKVI